MEQRALVTAQQTVNNVTHVQGSVKNANMATKGLTVNLVSTLQFPNSYIFILARQFRYQNNNYDC